MEIERVHPGPARAGGLESVSETSAARRADRALQAYGTAGADEAKPAADVDISERGRELARVQRAVQEAADVRTEKVEQIRKSIADGTYSVSADTLARKLLGGA